MIIHVNIDKRVDPKEKRKLAKRFGRLVAKVMIGDLTKNHSKMKQKKFQGGGGWGAQCP